MAEATTQQVRIERMAYGPEAVGRLESGKTVFVAGAVPGDLVEVAVDREAERYCNGHVSKVLEASPDRVVPECPYAAVCGGCPWAQMSYEAQARHKRDGVASALARIGRMGEDRAEALVAPLVSPSAPWGYRNKVELAVVESGGRLSLGMHAADGSGVVAVKACKLLDKGHQGVVKSVGGCPLLHGQLPPPGPRARGRARLHPHPRGRGRPVGPAPAASRAPRWQRSSPTPASPPRSPA